MKTAIFFASSLAAVCIAAAPSAQAAAVVDQSQTVRDTGFPFEFDFGGVIPNYPVGQTFTAGRTGELTGINIFSNGAGDGGLNSVTLEILGAGGLSDVLGTVTEDVVLNDGIFDYGLGLYVVHLDTSSLGIRLTAGGQYGFAITNVGAPSGGQTAGDFAPRGILASTKNPYAGGSVLPSNGYGAQPTWDLAFQTFVDTSVGAAPEPATWALMMVGVGGMGAALRDRRRKAGAAA